MRRRRKGYRKYKFTEKTLSKRGIAALVLAVISLVSFVIITAIAFKKAGALTIYAACCGIMAAIIAVVALILSIVSLREENSYRTIPYAATFLSIADVLMRSAIYIGGAMV